MSHTKLGEILIKGGSITKGQLDMALKIQQEKGGLLGEILIGLGFIHDEELIKALRQQAD